MRYLRCAMRFPIRAETFDGSPSAQSRRWNRGLGPRWYPIALAVLAIPQCWVGGRLYVMRSGKR
jgi:hypothetical protein